MRVAVSWAAAALARGGVVLSSSTRRPLHPVAASAQTLPVDDATQKEHPLEPPQLNRYITHFDGDHLWLRTHAPYTHHIAANRSITTTSRWTPSIHRSIVIAKPFKKSIDPNHLCIIAPPRVLFQLGPNWGTPVARPQRLLNRHMYVIVSPPIFLCVQVSYHGPD